MPGRKRKRTDISPFESLHKIAKCSSKEKNSAEKSAEFSQKLRRATTLTVTDEETGTGNALIKKCPAKEEPLGQDKIKSKSSRFVIEDGFSGKKSIKKVKTLNISEANTDEKSPRQVPNIPSGLTKLMFSPIESQASFSILESDLIDTINDDEMMSALASLKSDPSDIIKTRKQNDKNSSLQTTEETGENKGNFELAGAIEIAEDTETTSAAPDIKVDDTSTIEKDKVTGSRDKCDSVKEINEDLHRLAEPTHFSAIQCKIIIAVHGNIEKIRSRIKQLVQKLHEYKPDVGIAIGHSGIQPGSEVPVVRWISYTVNTGELCQFVDSIVRTFGDPDVVTERALRQAFRENISDIQGSDLIWIQYPPYKEPTCLEDAVFFILQNCGLLKEKKDTIKNRGKTSKKTSKVQPDKQKTVSSSSMKFTKSIARRKSVRNSVKDTKVPHKIVTRTKSADKTPSALAKKCSGEETLPRREIPLREQLTDVEFNIGPMKTLKWTDWFLAICRSVPRGHSPTDFKRGKSSDLYHNKCLDYELGVDVFYELGVKIPENKDIVPVYYRHCFHTTANKGVLTLYFLQNRKIRMEVERLLKNSCEIYIRRATVEGKGNATKWVNTNHVKHHLKTIDYAWCKHGKRGHRKVIKDKIVISDDTL